MMRRRRPMRWNDIPAGFRRLYRDPSNLIGIGAGLAVGAATYFVLDAAANYIIEPFRGASSYGNLNEAADTLRVFARLGEVALSGYLGWKACHGARDFIRGRF